MKSYSSKNNARHKDNVGVHQYSNSGTASAFLFPFSLLFTSASCRAFYVWACADGGRLGFNFRHIFLMRDPLCFLRQGLSLIWNSSVRLGSLAIKAQKHSHLCLPSSRTESIPSCLPFSHVFLESNSGPHAFATSALLTGPSLQSYICNND